MFHRDLLDVVQNRTSAEEALARLKSRVPAESAAAGKELCAQAAELGLSVRDYLTLAIDPHKGEFAEKINGEGRLNGWDLAKIHLGLPIADDFANGIVLQAAGETFQTFPGTRALFPEVIDDMLTWKYRQDQIESVEPMLASSRTISGTELLSTVVDDKGEDYQQFGPVAELGRFPVRSIRTSQQSVKIFKFGGGYRLSYEFSRRASLDILTPYANRLKREIEIAKVKAATLTLINGDGAYGAVTPVNQSSLATAAQGGATAAGAINWYALLAHLVDRAQAGLPADTVVGNWDTFLQWQLMFAKPDLNDGLTKTEVLAKAGVGLATRVPSFNMNLNFVVSSSMTASQIMLYSRGDTMEQLIEAGSQISESAKAIENQSITYVMSENSGFRLAHGDTRTTLNLDAIA